MTIVTMTTQVCCLQPRCIPVGHQRYNYDGLYGGLETFLWYPLNTSDTLPKFYRLAYHHSYSTHFEFPRNCTIKAIGVEFAISGNCHLSVSYQNGLSEERSVEHTYRAPFTIRHWLPFSVLSSHRLKIIFTVQRASHFNCWFHLNEAHEPRIALHVQEGTLFTFWFFM